MHQTSTHESRKEEEEDGNRVGNKPHISSCSQIQPYSINTKQNPWQNI